MYIVYTLKEFLQFYIDSLKSVVVTLYALFASWFDKTFNSLNLVEVTLLDYLPPGLTKRYLPIV